MAILPSPDKRILAYDPSRASDAADAMSYAMLYQNNYLDEFQSRSRLDRVSDDHEGAFWSALARWRDVLDADHWPVIDLKHPTRSRYPIEFLADWMWGPRGEFVALARTPGLNSKLDNFRVNQRRGFEYRETHMRADVHLEIVALDPRDLWLITGRARRNDTVLVRFSDYASLDIWREAAARAEPRREPRIKDMDFSSIERRVLDHMSLKAIMPKLPNLLANGGV